MKSDNTPLCDTVHIYNNAIVLHADLTQSKWSLCRSKSVEMLQLLLLHKKICNNSNALDAKKSYNNTIAFMLI